MIPTSPIETYSPIRAARKRIAALETQVGQYRDALASITAWCESLTPADLAKAGFLRAVKQAQSALAQVAQHE